MPRLPLNISGPTVQDHDQFAKWQGEQNVGLGVGMKEPDLARHPAMTSGHAI